MVSREEGMVVSKEGMVVSREEGMVVSKEGMVGVGTLRGGRVADSKVTLLAVNLQLLLSCLSMLPLRQRLSLPYSHDLRISAVLHVNHCRHTDALPGSAPASIQLALCYVDVVRHYLCCGV